MQHTNSHSLNILILSDIHLQKQYLEKLKIWYLQSTKKNSQDIIDIILIPGDFCNIPYQQPPSKTSQQQLQALAQLTLVLQFLEFFGCQIIYLPGNHDPLQLFQEENTKGLTKNSFNLHKKNRNIAQNLIIYGFGGSVPGYLNGLKVWQGFPYDNEQEFQVAFKKFWPKQTQSQFLLMTHIGPNNSHTTLARNQNQQIKSGSCTLDEYVSQMNKNLLIMIHGHTHDGNGIGNINRIPILNPGALTQGRFGILKLIKKQGRWGIKQTRFLNLNYI